MIDLHCHMLPGIDDGAPDLDTAIEMARRAVADGIQVTACTPHIYPGLFDNTAQGIGEATAAFAKELQERDIPLELTFGADVHQVPEVLSGLRNGRIPTLHNSRYFLLEPSHHVFLPGMEDYCFNLVTAGYTPVLTHPERLSWIGEHYSIFPLLASQGVWMQITAGSLTGRFGPPARYYAERMLDEGIVHLLATDAHGIDHRPPHLAEGRLAAERWVGQEEARRLVDDRPRSILNNVSPEKLIIL